MNLVEKEYMFLVNAKRDKRFDIVPVHSFWMLFSGSQMVASHI
jgi:hypothetical protein